jgi:hypothetical protein
MKSRTLVFLVLVLALLLGEGQDVLAQGGRATRVRRSGTLPATCDAAKGEIFFKTTAPIGIHQCIATDTWERMFDSSLEGSFSISILDPTTSETNKIQIKFPVNVTLQVISGSALPASSTVSINFDERAEATPNASGTDVLSAALVLDDNNQDSCSSDCDVNTITNGTIAANAPLNLQITAVSGAPTAARIYGYYTID